MMRALLFEKNFPNELWGEAASTAIYILNRSRTKSLQGLTPYEAWTGSKPNINHLRIFECLAHVKILGGHLKMLDPRSKPMVFIGYVIGSKAYKFYDPDSRKVEISRDVIFEEDCTWKWSRETVKSAGGTFSIDPSYDLFSLPNDHHEDSSHSLAEDEPSNEDAVDPSLGEREDATPLRHKSIQSVHGELDDVEPELQLTFGGEPTSFVEANEEEVWRNAMIE